MRYVYDKVSWDNEQVTAIVLLTKLLRDVHSPALEGVISNMRDVRHICDPKPVLTHYLYLHSPGPFDEVYRSQHPMYELLHRDLVALLNAGFSPISPGNSEIMWTYQSITRPKIYFYHNGDESHYGVQVDTGFMVLTEEFLKSPYYIAPGAGLYVIRWLHGVLHCQGNFPGYHQWTPSV